MRQKLTELNIQLIWLSHATTGEVIDSYGLINNTLFDDGETVEIYFPFNAAKNEELTHVVFGEDYEIQLDKPLSAGRDNELIGTTKIDIAIDGTYSVFTEVPVQIISVEGAIARTKNGVVKVLPEIGESDRMAIAFCPETNRFIRTPDLKNKSIELFRAKAVYPRWVDYKRKTIDSKVGIKLEDQPLNEINLHLFNLEDGIPHYRIYLAQVRRVPIQERRTVASLQPSDARRIKLHSLVLKSNNPVVAAT